jgi:hypothetical protein
MAAGTLQFAGFLTDNAGDAVSAATVELFPRNSTSTATTSTTTNSSGYWAMTTTTQGRFDVRITTGSSVRFLKYDDEVQLNSLETGSLRLRNPANTFEYDIVPAAIAAARTLNMPLITGSDTLATLGLAATFSAIMTHSADIILQDGVDLGLGTGSDGLFRLSAENTTGTAEDIVLALSNNTQALHITDAAAVATDWALANTTHPNVYIHSNTTPATDYLRLGGHTGTVADIDVLGGTTLQLKIAGNIEATVTASGLTLPANSDLVFSGTTGTNDITLTDSVADALSIVRGSTDFMVFNTSTPSLTITPVTTITGLVTASGGITFGAGADVTFTGTTGTNDITLVDSLADALSIVRGSTDFMVFNTSTPLLTITPAVTVTGIVTAASSSVFGNLTIGDGSIVDSSGAISFGNENLSTTGSIDAGTDFTIGDLVVTDGVLTDSTGLALAGNVTVTGNVLPNADDTYDLGSASAAWQDLFLEGDITLTDAGTIATSAGALTLDATTDIVLDAGGADVILKDDGTQYGAFTQSSNTTVIKGFVRHMGAMIVDAATDVSTGDAKYTFVVPAEFNGAELVTFTAHSGLDASDTGPAGSTMDIQLRRVRSGTDADMMSTKIGIADGADVSAAGAVNTSNDDVATGDLIHIDIDQVGSGTAGKGLVLVIGFKIPF